MPSPRILYLPRGVNGETQNEPERRQERLAATLGISRVQVRRPELGNWLLIGAMLLPKMGAIRRT